MKHRRYFTLHNAQHSIIGHGIYYPKGGNVQVYLKAHDYQAWQFASLAEALLLDGVSGFQWETLDITPAAQHHKSDTEADTDNLVWARIDGFYDKSEFSDNQ